MTDIIFLLLIFFMVTSTYLFPTALELNLPQSSEQTAIKPSTRVYVFSEGRMLAQFADEPPVEVTSEGLESFLLDAQGKTEEGQSPAIAIYADEDVVYGEIVKILDIGARRGLKMVLATKASPSKVENAGATPEQTATSGEIPVNTVTNP